MARISAKHALLALIASFVAWVLYPFDNFVIKPEDVAGKRVVVTGASLGIGRALAIEYARMGAGHICLVSRSEAGLLKVRDEIWNSVNKNVKIDVIPANLNEELPCNATIEKAVSAMGGIDALVLNHIIQSRYGSWLKMGDRARYLEDTFRVNTFSYIWLATAAIQDLIKSSGQIVVVSSLAGHVGTPKTAVYSASKHALHGFFGAFENELKMMGVYNVGVTMCAIGATNTEGAIDIKTKISTSWDPPEDAARAIIIGGALRRAHVYHPRHVVLPSIILHRVAPDLINYFIRSSLQEE
jgi:short-subunit dehydrogenase